MSIKLTTWNMAHWSHKKHSADAWKYFLTETDSDIFLFQESYPDSQLVEKEHLVWNAIGGTRPWGSGVYSPNFQLKEYSFKNNFHGAVTASEIQVNDGLALIVISLYGLMEQISGVTYAIPNLHRMFSDLTEILEFSATRHRVVIGGDFNASEQLDEVQTGDAHRVFFDRLKEFGLVNCFDGYYDDYVQTHRHSRSKKPWQNDYFFISRRLEKYLKNCEVLDNDMVRKFSDHNPVLIELDV